MPELNLGFRQNTLLPFYITVKNADGSLLAQPPGFPSIEITYIDPIDHTRGVSIAHTPMSEIEVGRYFFIWRILEDEPTVNHIVVVHALSEDGEPIIPSDDSFAVTGLQQNPTFSLNINVLLDPGICYPEVTQREPKCTGRRMIPAAHAREQDIGLDDFVQEGVFRFGEFPNQVVDRRVIGGTTFTFSLARNFASSIDPGAGPAQRPGNPLVQGPYTARKRYRY